MNIVKLHLYLHRSINIRRLTLLYFVFNHHDGLIVGIFYIFKPRLNLSTMKYILVINYIGVSINHLNVEMVKLF